MAEKPVDPDPALLVQLADNAHKLVREYIAETDARMREELLVALESVIVMFRELQPPPIFSNKLKLVKK